MSELTIFFAKFQSFLLVQLVKQATIFPLRTLDRLLSNNYITGNFKIMPDSDHIFQVDSAPAINLFHFKTENKSLQASAPLLNSPAFQETI